MRILRMVCFLAMVLALAFVACSSDSQNTEVFLSADPGSLEVGQAITATVIASENFFLGNLDKEDVTEGGLTLTSLHRQDRCTALVELRASDDATVGAHELSFSMGGKRGVLRISVVNPTAGPGTVSVVSGDRCTAGAMRAPLRIRGVDTHFDSNVSVSIEGADGVTVNFVEIVTESVMEVDYSVSFDQKPTVARVVIKDGATTFEVPLTILETPTYQNSIEGQVLTKGQGGLVRLSNDQAELTFGTRFERDDELVRAGDSEVVAENTVEIPVRVPFDYSEDELALRAMTYHEGGAILEIVETTISLAQPAYIASIPSRLPTEFGDIPIEIIGEGMDMMQMTDLSVSGHEKAAVIDVDKISFDAASMILGLMEGADDGPVYLKAMENGRVVRGVVVLSDQIDPWIYESLGEIPAGDHLYLAIVLSRGNLTASDLVMTGDAEVEVLGLTFIDESCVVAEIKVDDNADLGGHDLLLLSGAEDWHVSVRIVGSVF